MKRIVIILLCLVFMPAFAEKLDLGNPLVVENFGANIVKNKLDTYDFVALGLWYLENNYRSKWNRVRDDEFELDDAKNWAFSQLKKKLAKTKPIDKNAEYHLYLNSRFTKYDFKSQAFPVEALSENSYMSYSGKGEFVNRYSKSRLSFENADESVNFIPMKKADAKKFIKLRKNSYGSINRQIVAHYIYTITNYIEDREFKSDGSPMSIKFVAKLKSVEFMDKSRKHILHIVDFEKIDDKSSDANTIK